MASIKLTSELYKNETISNITFTPTTNYSGKKNQEFDIPNPDGGTLGVNGYTFDPGELVTGLTPGDIFGEYVITYANGCNQDITVDGETAGCGDFTATVVSEGLFYHGQSSESLFPYQNNGFILNSVNPDTISNEADTTYYATYDIPETDPLGTPFDNWLNGAGTLDGCASGQVPNHVRQVTCEDSVFDTVTFTQNPNQGVTIEAFNLPEGVSASITPAFHPDTETYDVQYTSIPQTSNIFFGLGNDGTPITKLNCDLTIISESFNCADYGFTLDNITPSTPNAEDIVSGAVSTSSLLSHLPLPTEASILSVLNQDGNDAWVLGAEPHTYTITISLQGTGLYNEDGDYEANQECTVSASACVNDIRSDYVPTSAQS